MPASTSRLRRLSLLASLTARLDHLAKLGLAAVGGGLVGILLLVIWDHQERGVRVVAVGTEGGISVLVTSGHRRVLIESGSTGGALRDGLDDHLPPLHRDLDLVMTDSGIDGGPAWGQRVARRWVLGDVQRTGSERLVSSSTISLPDGVAVRLLLEPGPDGGRRGWVTIVERGQAVVAIAGGGGPWVSSVVARHRPGVVIIAREDSTEVSQSATPPLLMTPAGDDRSSSTGQLDTVVRLFPAQSYVFRLRDSGVEVPSPLSEQLDQRAATPRTSSRPLLGTRSSNSRRISARSSSELRTSRPARAIALATKTAFR